MLARTNALLANAGGLGSLGRFRWFFPIFFSGRFLVRSYWKNHRKCPKLPKGASRSEVRARSRLQPQAAATCSVSPVIHLPSSDTTNVTEAAMSAGWPMRPSGVRATNEAAPSSPMPLVPPVAVRPGAMPTTRILRGPSSSASERVRLSTAPLVAL